MGYAHRVATLIARTVLSGIIAGCLTISGCAMPFVRTSPQATAIGFLSKYQTVYLLQPEQDPREVAKQLVTRFGALGFQVRSITEHDPLIGSQGTGFVIGSAGHVLTCAHVLEDRGTATLWINEQHFTGQVVCVDKEADLAVVKLRESAHFSAPPLPFNRNAVVMGQGVSTIGFPLSSVLGKQPRLSSGLISATVGLRDDPKHLQVSVETQSGSSGSPLLDQQGHVIGIMQQTLDPWQIAWRTGGSLPQNVNFALKSNVMLDFLRTCKVDLPIDSDSPPLTIEQVRQSLARIRGGTLPPNAEDQPKLLAVFSYHSIWDMWFRFQFFQVNCYDLDSGELLLEAGQYGDNPFTTESVVLDRTFREIGKKFLSQGNSGP